MYIYLYLIYCFLSPKYKLNSYSNYDFIARKDKIDHLLFAVKIIKSKGKKGARIWYFFKA